MAEEKEKNGNEMNRHHMYVLEAQALAHMHDICPLDYGKLKVLRARDEESYRAERGNLL